MMKIRIKKTKKTKKVKTPKVKKPVNKKKLYGFLAIMFTVLAIASFSVFCVACPKAHGPESGTTGDGVGTSAPAEPGTTVPGTDPVEPGTDSVDPGTDPVEPGTDPVEPGTDPVEPETEPGKTIVKYRWYSGILRHKVIYSDGTYDMEDCDEHDCVCGRDYN